jgi:hypothetical protein
MRLSFVGNMHDSVEGRDATTPGQELPQFPHDGVRRGPMLEILVERGVCCCAIQLMENGMM